MQDNGGDDNSGEDYSELTSFTIDVESINDAPSINVISDIETDEDVNVSFQVTVNDVDIDTNSDELFFDFDLSNESLVTVNVSYNDSTNLAVVTLDLFDHQFGESTITMNVTDLNGDSDSKSFDLSVNSVNDAPEVLLLTDQTTLEDTAIEGLTFSVNDVETASPNLAVSFANTNTSLFPSGSVVYTSLHNGYWTLDLTPYTNQYGDSTFYVYVDDGDITTEYSFDVYVEDVNDKPIAYSMSIETQEDVTASITLEAIDLDLDDLYFSVIDAEHGSVYLDGDVVTYIPDENYFGDDVFIYRANDGQISSEVATVNITVTPVNDLPELLLNEFYVTENNSLAFELEFYDVDSDQLSWETLNLSTGLFDINLADILDDNDDSYFTQSLLYDTQLDINGTATSLINVYDQEAYTTFNLTFYINMEDQDGDGVRDRDDVFDDDPLLSTIPVADTAYLAPPGIDDDEVILWLDSKQPHGDQSEFSHLDTIQTWIDLSGSNYSAVQDTVASRPKVYMDGTANYIQFDQSQFMEIISDNYFDLAEMSLVVIFAPNDVGVDQTLISSEYGSNGFQNKIAGSDSVFSYIHYFNSVLNEIGLYKVRYDVPNVSLSSFSADVQSLKLNGSYSIDLDQVDSTYYQQVMVSIGSPFDSATNFYSGKIYEVILYNKALDDYDFKLLSVYLREKWGVYILDQQIFFE